MRNHFGGRSRQSLVIARGFIDAAAKGSTADAASQLSTELFFIASVLNSNISLRRAVNDPSRDAKSKAVLLKEILGKSVGASALNVITGVSELRWSASSDLVEVVEQLAIEAEASAANIANELDRVESELFTVARAISTSFELRSALITAGADKAKSALVAELLGKNSSSSTREISPQYGSGSKATRGPLTSATQTDTFFLNALKLDSGVGAVSLLFSCI